MEGVVPIVVCRFIWEIYIYHKQHYNMNKRNRKHNHHERSRGLLGEVEARAKDGRGGSHCCMQVHMGYIYILFLFFL